MVIRWSGVNLADSQDGLYNPEKAKRLVTKAKEALQTRGVQFPNSFGCSCQSIKVVFVDQNAINYRQSIESALGKDNVM